jgi:hypothetical protein
MQITSGSLTGRFGRTAGYWAERMLEDSCAHISGEQHDIAPAKLGQGTACSEAALAPPMRSISSPPSHKAYSQMSAAAGGDCLFIV